MVLSANRKLLLSTIVFMMVLLAACLLTPVSAHAANYYINKGKLTMYTGDTYQLAITTDAADGTRKSIDPYKVNWFNDKYKIAAVGSDGIIVAKKPGYTKIGATIGGQTFYVKTLVLNREDKTYAAYGKPAYNVKKGNAIVQEAFKWAGGKGKYRAGACTKGHYDCSGFVSWCIAKKRIGNTYTFLAKKSKRVKKPMPGDICVRKSHAGIYIGNGMMIHAVNKKRGVRVGKVEKGMVYVRIYK